MVEARTRSGSLVLLQTASSSNAFEAQALDERITVDLTKISSSMGDFIEDIAAEAKRALTAAAPDSFEVEVGFMVGAEGSLIVTKGKAEAHVTVKVHWGK